MPTPDPPAPSRLRRALGPVQAGAIAGSGSALGLAAAIALDSAPGHTRPTALWMAVTGGAFAAAVLRGYPDARVAPPRPLLERVLGVAVFGFLLGGLPISLVFDRFARPRDDAEAIQVLVATGVALLVAGLLGRSSTPLAARLDEAAKDVGPGAPPPPDPPTAALDAREVESEDPAVEVRVLWGADPLSVAHLSPPRSFHAGDGGDLVMDTGPLGAATLPIVVVRDGAASAVVPRGASGMIQQRGRRASLGEALDEGLAAPFEEVPGAHRIPLVLGTRVTMSLPVRTPQSAYRASHEGREPGDTPVVVEVAMVRAGRAVRRAPSFAGAGRVALGVGCALAIVAGIRAWNPGAPPVCTEDCDEPSPDVALFMSQQLAAAAWREDERQQELEDEGTAPDGTTLRFHWEARKREPVPARRADRMRGDQWMESAFQHDRPFEIPADMASLGPRFYCWDDGAPLEDEAFPTVLRVLCASPQYSSFGLRVQGPPPSVDMLGRDPTDFWSLRYALAWKAAPHVEPPGSAKLDAKLVRTTEGLDANAFERLLVARRAALRDCQALGQRYENASSAFALSFVVGAGGIVTTAWQRDVEGRAEETVARCMTAALVGAQITPRPGRVANADVRFELRVNK